MKSLFFSFMIMLCGVTMLSATSNKDDFKKFLEYDNSLNTSLHHGCSGSGALGGSCSAMCGDKYNCVHQVLFLVLVLVVPKVLTNNLSKPPSNTDILTRKLLSHLLNTNFGKNWEMYY